MSANIQATTVGPAPVRAGSWRWLIVAAAVAVGIVSGVALGQAIGLGSSGTAPGKAPAVTRVQGQPAHVGSAFPVTRPAAGTGGTIPAIRWSSQCSMGRVLVRC